MRAPLAPLKAEADYLANRLPRLTNVAGPASAAHPGTAGRRRAGAGENFWQYRRYSNEDGAQRIDWRRSARGNHLYVRETELETSRTFLFWVDPSEGFNWSGTKGGVTKAERALVISLGLARLLVRSGERCGALGGPRAPSSGPRAVQLTAEDLWTRPYESPFPPPYRDPSSILLASDFYQPMDIWKARIKAHAANHPSGVILAVADPIETTYPFEGRVRLFDPGNKQARLLGRAENLKSAYLEKFSERRNEIKHLAQSVGWGFVAHTTNEPAQEILAQIASFFENRRRMT